MMITIDASGRIVLPKPLRQKFGFDVGTELTVVEQADGLLLRPSEKQPAMEKQGGIWTHKGAAPAGLRWDRLTDDMREQRLTSIVGV